MFLIADRLPAHEAQAVADWIAEHGDRIELFWLPKYAPELNAEEYLNNDLNGSIGAAGLPESTGGSSVADGAVPETSCSTSRSAFGTVSDIPMSATPPVYGF